MSGLREFFGALFDGGAASAAALLLLISLGLWIVIIERGRALGGLAGLALSPGARKRRAQARARLARTFQEFLAEPASAGPDDDTSGASADRSPSLVAGPVAGLVAASRAADGPTSRLFLRFLEDGAPQTADVRDVRLRAARILCEREIGGGFPSIALLGRLALLAGLLGNVAALAETLRVAGTSSPLDPAAWRVGLPSALVFTELGAAAALLALLSGSWLRRLSRSLEEEIRIACRRLEAWNGPWGRKADA